MTQALGNVAVAFQQHPFLLLAIAAGFFVLAVAAFSGNQVGSVVEGMFRLLGSIFTAPVHFLRSVVQALLRFRADDAAESRSRTFLLWRSVQYALFLAFVVSLAMGSAGVTIAVLGLWPSAQLAERKELSAALETADTTFRADSQSLATLMASNPAQAAKQRADRLTQLQQRRDELRTQFSPVIDSINSVNNARGTFVSEVWRSASDELLSNKALVIAQVDSFVERHKGDYESAELDQIRRFVHAEIAGQEMDRERSALEQAGSPDDQIKVLEMAVNTDRERLASLKEARSNINYFAGVRFFFTTLLLTYLYLVIFVWAVGTAIESVSLFIGLSRDLAVVRQTVGREDSQSKED